ncbi:hypothetical protein BCR42DRAFT_404552 [Absidia repens]|uniref:Uncharacterized protein n=1 Tax=Absidia repens TaxID=90262 RepID=A0A1X2IWA4_9FUNG|nr:hypothetical protein BCR42DRAFT_404552 [Absidia repens]
MSVKTQRLDRLRAKLKEQDHGFSLGLKQAFAAGNSPTYPTDLDSTKLDPLTRSHLEPIINNTRPSLRHRPLRSQRHVQQTVDTDSQKSLTAQDHEPDITAILEKLDPLLSRIQQQTVVRDSQPSSQGRTATFQELLGLSIDEIKVACDHIDFDTWSENVLADLCHAYDSMENLAYPVACTVVQSSLYPYILKLNISTSRLLMNNILQLGKSYGNVILNGLILPLLGTHRSDHTQIGRPQLELASKLITSSLNVSSRTTFLRSLLSGNEGAAPSDTVLQLMNTLASSTNPFIPLDGAMTRQLIQACYQVVQGNPKDKTSMQLLLTLTSKHAQALVDANLLDDLEAVASQSNMFLKRSVLGQLVTIRKKTAQGN